MTSEDRRWAQQMFGSCDLGDARRTRRLEDVAARLASHAGDSLASSCQSSKAAALGAYRLIGNDNVCPQAIAEGGFAAVAQMASGHEGDLLAVEDTTSVVYAHTVAAQLGTTGSRCEAKQRGYLVHSVLLLHANSERTVGLLEQRRWCRDDASYGKKHARKQRAYEDKESFKWQQASERIEQRLDAQTLGRVISVCDRECDIYEYLRYKLERGQRFVVRAQADRVLSDQQQTLFAKLQSPDSVLYESQVEIAQRGGRLARKASLRVCACGVSLSAPANRGAGSPALRVNVVRVYEEAAEQEKARLNWVLLTSEAVDSAERVKKIVRYYELRWRIEEYHKAWKSGVGVERLRQQSEGNLERMVVITAFVAVRVLQLRERVGQESESALPCDGVLEADEWRMLWLLDHKEKKAPLPASPPSLAWACLAIARLGGFLDTKHTGRPGWKTLWDGWLRLQDRVEGLRLARELGGGGTM
ncbi:MAG: IS4 family transposase [Burkholderiaceae bacterium]|nr:IS4 family transposase [Burkholderiaceae bacterium]